jgi:hypothetical protein
MQGDFLYENSTSTALYLCTLTMQRIAAIPLSAADSHPQSGAFRAEKCSVSKSCHFDTGSINYSPQLSQSEFEEIT